MRINIVCAIFFLLLLTILKSNAQGFQVPAFQHLYQNTINPALQTVGKGRYFDLVAISQNSISNIDGAPQTHTLLINNPIFFNQALVGLSLQYDEITIFKNFNLAFQYAYIIPSRKGEWSLGLKYHAYWEVVDVTDLDQSINPNSITSSNNFYSGIDLGIYYKMKKGGVGFFSNHLFVPLNENQFNVSNPRKEIGTHGNFNYSISENFSLVNFIRLSYLYNFQNWNIGLASLLKYKEVIQLGIFGSESEQVSILLNTAVSKKIDIGYSGTILKGNGFRNQLLNTHEIIFRLRLKELKRIAVSPLSF